MTSAAYQEEIFGPVLIVNTFDDEIEMIKEANGTEFGLFCMFSSKHTVHSSLITFSSLSIHPRSRASHPSRQGAASWRSWDQLLGASASLRYAHRGLEAIRDGKRAFVARSEPVH